MNNSLNFVIPEKPKKNYFKITLIIAVLTFIIVWAFSAMEYRGFANTLAGVPSIFDAIFSPDWNFLLPGINEGAISWSDVFTNKDFLLYLTVETVAIAIAGTFLSAVLAIPVALISSQNIVSERFSKFGKFLITAIRTFPEIILAIIFVTIVGVGAPAGVLALGVHSVGMLGKLFSESVESMDIGVKEAVESCGGNQMEVLFRAVIPQVAPEFLSYTLFRFEINMRAATILGIVGGGGIGAPLIVALNSNQPAAW